MFPDNTLVPRTYSNKGEAISEAVTIQTLSGQQRAVLSHYARGKSTLTNGSIVASSISVYRGGQVYTEVYDLPVPTGYYFYHLTDISIGSSVLIFNPTETGSVNATYETRGDYIDATRATEVEADLAAVETSLGEKSIAYQSGILLGDGGNQTITVDVTRVPGSKTVTELVVILTTEDPMFPAPGFTVAGDNRSVTLTSTPSGVNIHYLLIVKV
jgi:hypothetical protein